MEHEVSTVPDRGLNLFTSYGLVLLTLAREPHLRVRDVARQLGYTERAVHRIITELAAEGFLRRHRLGRRNSYSINGHATFHSVITVNRLLEALGFDDAATRMPLDEAV